MMNKWVKMREAGNAPRMPTLKKRPVLASECNNLDEAERFRRQLLREITELISKIQNPGLGEHALRDMNDEINRKMREKHHWNKRILHLGGANYDQREQKQQMENGGDWQQSILGSGGYRYFGAAKDLPGVQELFAKAAAAQQKKRRKRDFKRLTPDYYGWRDEEDGVLLQVEAEASKRLKQEIVNKGGRVYEEDELEFDAGGGADDTSWSVPTHQALEAALLERKKRALLDRLKM